MKVLTECQRETMQAIVECIYWDGRPPTIRELGARFMILPNAVLDRVVALRKKGWLERQDGTRSLVPTGMSLDEPVVERVLRMMKHFEQQRLASKEKSQGAV